MTKRERTHSRDELKNKLFLEDLYHIETVQQSHVSTLAKAKQVIKKRKGLNVYSVEEPSTNQVI